MVNSHASTDYSLIADGESPKYLEDYGTIAHCYTKISQETRLCLQAFNNELREWEDDIRP
jgi:hypothetical protein